MVAALIGACASGAPPAYIKAIVDWVPTRSRGRGVGIIEASIPIGGVIATVLVTTLAVSFSWRMAVLVLAIIAATYVLPTPVSVPVMNRPEKGDPPLGFGELEKIDEDLT